MAALNEAHICLGPMQDQYIILSVTVLGHMKSLKLDDTTIKFCGFSSRQQILSHRKKSQKTWTPFRDKDGRMIVRYVDDALTHVAWRHV